MVNTKRYIVNTRKIHSLDTGEKTPQYGGENTPRYPTTPEAAASYAVLRMLSLTRGHCWPLWAAWRRRPPPLGPCRLGRPASTLISTHKSTAGRRTRPAASQPQGTGDGRRAWLRGGCCRPRSRPTHAEQLQASHVSYDGGHPKHLHHIVRHDQPVQSHSQAGVHTLRTVQ